jgi:hypothetical protein
VGYGAYEVTNEPGGHRYLYDDRRMVATWERVDEWTPEVSARGGARALAERADGNPDRDVVLVAEDDRGLLGRPDA